MTSWRIRWLLLRTHLAVRWHGLDSSQVVSVTGGTIQRSTVQRNRPRDGLH